MSLHNPISPLHAYYVQKVLPAVYDDSLSYYEILCKVQETLDEVVATTNEQSVVVLEMQQAIYDFIHGGYTDTFEEYLDEWFEDNSDEFVQRLIDEGVIPEVEDLQSDIETAQRNIADLVASDESIRNDMASAVTELQSNDVSIRSDMDAADTVLTNTKVPYPVVGDMPSYGTGGQVLSTNADGSTEWADPVIPSDEQAEEVITSWLNAHPEATTTVQDGAITTPKLANGSVTDAKLVQSGGVLEEIGNLKTALNDTNSLIFDIAPETKQFFNKQDAIVTTGMTIESDGKIASVANGIIVAIQHSILDGNRYSCNIITNESYSATSGWKVCIGDVIPQVDAYVSQISTIAGATTKGGRIDASSNATYFYLTFIFGSEITSNEIANVVDNLVARKGELDNTTYYPYYTPAFAIINDDNVSETETWSSEKIDQKTHKHLNYVTPQMFGALGDGEHDDTQAIRDALQASDIVILPIGTYKITYNIPVTTGKTLMGESFSFGGSSEGYEQASSNYLNKTIVIDASGASSACGIVCYGREITLQGFTFIGNVQIAQDGNHIVPVDETQDTTKCTGITLGVSSTYRAFDSYCCTFKNLILKKCLYGINTGNTNFWDNTFENIRIEYCQHGIYSPSNGESDFSNTFKNIIVLHTPECLYMHDVEAVFIACNFGLQNKMNASLAHAITLIGSCMIDFVGCNFECDEIRDAPDAILSLRSGRFHFDCCMFWARCTAQSRFIETSIGTSALVFTGNRYNVYSANLMSADNFFVNDGDYSKMQGYGSVVYNGGNNNVSGSTYSDFPRPVYADAQLPQLLDLERGQPMRFRNNVIDKTKLHTGVLLFDETLKKICTFDGTNIVDMNGTIVA